MKFNEIKNKKLTNTFLAVGGTAALIGLFATTPELATNLDAQQIGIYAAAISALGMGGAAWNWATKIDHESGTTIASELKGLKSDFNNILGRIRKEFDDEFATNQGLDDKSALDEALKVKTMKR
jgi:hypothetical protein